MSHELCTLNPIPPIKSTIPIFCPASSAGASAQRWRVSRNGEVTFGIVRRFRRRWRRNGARDRIGEGPLWAAAGVKSRFALPNRRRPFMFFNPHRAPFRQRSWRNLHHNPLSSAGGTSLLTHAAPLAEPPSNQQINNSTPLPLQNSFRFAGLSNVNKPSPVGEITNRPFRRA